MSEKERPDMQEWEAQINALMDGELDDPQAGKLKAAAGDEPALARAIIEAYQLQQALAEVPLDRAPPSLRRKLRRIPREQRAPGRTGWMQPRWAAAIAAVPLVVLLAVQQMRPAEPTQAEVAQARQDLAMAFAYLEEASRKTGLRIGSTLDQGLSEPIAETTVRAIHEQFDLSKENGA